MIVNAMPTSTCGTVTFTLLPCSMSITAGCEVSIDAGLKSSAADIINNNKLSYVDNSAHHTQCTFMLKSCSYLGNLREYHHKSYLCQKLKSGYIFDKQYGSNFSQFDVVGCEKLTFEVIQGHQFYYQLKACMRLPISE